MTTPRLVLIPQVYIPDQKFVRYQVLGGSSFPPGTNIKITVPVTNLSSVSAPVKLKLMIYEGSFLATHGDLLKTYTSAEYTITSGGSKNFDFNHTTLMGSIDRRDVGVELSYRVGTVWTVATSDEWDDLYYVTQEAYSFDIGIPSMSQV